MMSTGAMIKIKSHVVVESADPTSDLHPGDTGIILGAESWTFDPDDKNPVLPPIPESIRPGPPDAN